MTKTAQTSFSVTDLVPEAAPLINSSIPTRCPLCEEEALYLYQPPPMSHAVLCCRSCDLLGTPVHLKARMDGIPYSIAAADCEGEAKGAQAARYLPAAHRELRQEHRKCQEYFSNNMNLLRAHFRSQYGYEPDQVGAFSQYVGCIATEQARRMDVIDEARPVFTVPHYAFGTVMSDLTYLDTGHRESVPLDRPNRMPGGALDLSPDHQMPALVTTDVRTLCHILAAYQVADTATDHAPFIHLATTQRPSLFYLHNTRRLVVRLQDMSPPYISTIARLPKVRCTDATIDTMQQALQYGAHGFVENLWERGMDFEQLIRRGMKDGGALQEAVEAANIDQNLLHRIMRDAPKQISEKMRSVWSCLDNVPVATVCGTTYYREKEGGYYRYKRHSGDPTRDDVANVHMQATERIVSDETTLCRGWLRHDGREVEAEMAAWPRQHTQQAIIRAFSEIGIETTPDFSMGPRRWMKINQAFSRPDTYSGASGCGMNEQGELLLPGVTIAPDRIQPVGRITIPDANFLPKGHINRSDEALSGSDRGRLQMLVAASLGLKFVQILLDRPPASVHLLQGDPSTLSTLHTMCRSAGLDRDVKGYPCLKSTVDTDRRVQIWDGGHIQAGRYHVMAGPAAGQGPTEGLSPTAFRLLWEALQVVMREEVSTRQCECGVYLDALRQVCEKRELRCPAGGMREQIVCSDLSG